MRRDQDEYVVENDTTLIQETLRVGDTIFNLETKENFRVNVPYVDSPSTLAQMILAGSIEPGLGGGGYINGGITKTVASIDSTNPGDFDFAGFYEMTQWLKSNTFDGFIKIILDDGIHYSEPADKYVDWANDNTIVALGSGRIDITASNKANCFITLDPAIPEFKGDMITANASYLFISKITLDPLHGGYTGAVDDITVIVSNNNNNSLVEINSCSILNARNGFYCLNGSGTLTLTLVKNCTSGLAMALNSIVNTFQPTFEDCTIGIDFTIISTGAILESAHVGPAYNPIFINCGTNCNIEANKLQPNNSIWYTKQVLWTGDTASRPTLTVANERTYFDTTLGKPIWYNGTAWVDAVGTIV